MLEIAMSSTATTLSISGDLDLAERDQFPEVAARVTGLRRQLLVIDMCRVTFLDSTGAAFLISLADSARKRGGAVVLRGCAERDLFVLEVCGSLPMFRIDRDHQCPPPRARRPVARGRPVRSGSRRRRAGSTTAQTSLPCAVGSQPHSASRSTIRMP